MRVARLGGREWRGSAVPHAAELAKLVGPGLIETMRARNGRIAHRELHLARLKASASACGYRQAGDTDRAAAALDALVESAGATDLYVRLVAGRGGLLLVESGPVAPLSATPPTAAALVVGGLWDPGAAADEHKRTERGKWVAAEAAAGHATVVLAADGRGRIGEGSRAAVFVVRDGTICTAPVTGILPGIGRRIVMDIAGDVVERAAEPELWRTADEMFVVSALRGVTAIVAVEGGPVGDGRTGPVTARIAADFRARVIARTGGNAGS